MGQNAVPWARKYTDQQNAAVLEAVLDRGIEPVAKVQALAREGALTVDGQPVEAFDMPATTISSKVRVERIRRAKKLRPPSEYANHETVHGAQITAMQTEIWEEIEAIQRSRKANRSDRDKLLERMLRVAKVLDQMSRITQTKPAPSTPQPTPPQAPTPTPTLAAGLLAANAQTTQNTSKAG